MSETLILAAVLVPCLIIAIVFHEVAHGWTALALGDPTAKERGRLSLNPIKHVDPVGTLLVPGLLAIMGGPVFGWAKPVPVLQRRLNNPRYGMMAVAAAGPATNIVLALFGAVALGLVALGISASPTGAILWVITGLNYFIVINIFLALFNLLPIPPFDGSHIVQGLLPLSLARHYAKLQRVGMLLLVGLIATTWIFPDSGIIDNVVMPPVEWVRGKFLALAIAIAS